MSDKNRKLMQNTVLLTIGSFASKLLSFFLVPFYTTVLSTSEYGISDLLVTTVNMVYPFFTLMISQAVLRYCLEKEYDKSQILTIGLTTASIGFGIMFAISPVVLLSPIFKDYYLYFVLYYLTFSIYILFSQFVKGIDKVKLFTIAGICNTILIITFNLIFLLGLKTGINGYLLSMILASALSSVVLFVGSRMHTYLISFRKINRGMMKSMYKYSLPLIPNSISWWISNSSDRYMITYFYNTDVTGIYSVSYKIPTLLSVFSEIFINAWQLSAVDGFGSEETRKFYSNIYNKYSSFNNLIASAIIIISHPLALLLFQKDFYSAWIFIPVLVFGFLFNTLANFIGTIYTSSKKTKMLFYSTLWGALANIGINFIFIPLWGAMGAAVSTFISYFMVWMIRLINSRSIMIMDMYMKKDIFCYMLLVAQILIVCINKNYSLLLSIVLFLIIFIVEKKFVFSMSKSIVLKIKSILKYRANIKHGSV